MKRHKIPVLLVLMLLTSMASGQYAQNALGIRFSGDDEGDGIGAEISYQRALGDGQRGELNLGIRETEVGG
ncbi:MAG: hypothetical protein U5L96_21555 [Owenweeksia sp.]|nr:hypothetical protein [Owenweeksia sp.]